MTRPEPASLRFWNSLPASLRATLRLEISPVLEIVPRALPSTFDPPDAYLFTSAQAVAVAQALGLPKRPSFAVGDTTAEAASRAGFPAQSANGNAEALLRLVFAQAPTGPLLHLRGAHSRGNIAARLAAGGFDAKEQVIYDQLPKSLSISARGTLDDANPVIVPLFSPRSAALFAAGFRGKAPLYLALMSEAIQKESMALPFKQCIIASEPSTSAMRDAVAQLATHMRQDRLVETPNDKKQ